MAKIIEAHYEGEAFTAFAVGKALVAYRLADRHVKRIDGPEARLADAILNETGVEAQIDSVIANLSGRWSARLPGFAISEDGRAAAVDRTI